MTEPYPDAVSRDEGVGRENPTPMHSVLVRRGVRESYPDAVSRGEGVGRENPTGEGVVIVVLSEQHVHRFPATYGGTLIFLY